MATNTNETRAQLETRIDATLVEHGRLLTEHLTAAHHHQQAADERQQIANDRLQEIQAADIEKLTRMLTTAVTSVTPTPTVTATAARTPVALPSATADTIATHAQHPPTCLATEPRDNRHHYRVGRIDFPRFTGTDISSWLFQCEHYFEVNETPEATKLKIVIIHLEGEALQWHHGYARTQQLQGQTLTWSDYIVAL